MLPAFSYIIIVCCVTHFYVLNFMGQFKSFIRRKVQDEMLKLALQQKSATQQLMLLVLQLSA